jgi:trigger factor
MKILKKEELPKCQLRLQIEVPKEELAKFLDRAYENLKSQVKVPGFRPGKAPRFIVEKEVGSEAFQKEALEIALPETYYDAIKEAEIKPVGPPEVKMVKFAPSDTLVYEATCSVMPKFELGDYKKVISKSKIKLQEVKVDEKQIDEVVKNLQKQRSENKEVNREARKGDRVEIDFEGFIDSKPIPGGSSKNHPIILGDGVMVPGFEEAIIGMKKNDEKEFELTFPKDFPQKNLAGQKAKFKVKVNAIQEVKLLEMTDALAKTLGQKSVSELRADIKKSLGKELKEREDLRFEGEILDKLVEEINVEIPQFLIDEELKGMLNNLEQRLSQDGLTLDRYLEQIKKTKEDLQKSWLSEAEKRIKIALLLDKVGEAEKIEISDKEAEDEIKKIISETPAERKEQTKKSLENDEQKRYIKNVLRNRKVVKTLKNYILGKNE